MDKYYRRCHIRRVNNKPVIDTKCTCNIKCKSIQTGTCKLMYNVYTNVAILTVNPNPVVHFAADINACGGVPLILNGNRQVEQHLIRSIAGQEM